MATEKLAGVSYDCIADLLGVLKRYDGKLIEHDARDILAHLAMAFRDHNEHDAALLLHEVGMDVVFYHGLAAGLDRREKEGKGC